MLPEVLRPSQSYRHTVPVVVQSLSRVWLFATPWIAALRASLSITNSQNLLKLMSIELVMPSNHLILCRPLLLLSSIVPSIRVFPAIGHWLWISHGRSSLGHMSNQTDPQSPQPGRWGILIWLIHTTRPLEEVLSTNWLKLTESLAPEWTSFIKIQWLKELGFC